MMKKYFLFTLILGALFAGINFVSAASGDSVTIQRRNITSVNAGTIINHWTGSSNFKTNFVLTGGLTKKIDVSKLDEAFEKTKQLKTKVSSMKSKNIDVGKIEVMEPELIQYPDRLRVVQKTKLVFDKKAQLDNFKKYVDSDIKETDNKKKLDEAVYSYYIKKCKADKKCVGKLTDAQLRDKIVAGLADAPKVLETEETIDYNLIPLDMNRMDEISASGFNLNQEPRDVRVNLQSVSARFDTLRQMGDIAQERVEDIMAGSGHEMTAEEYCYQYYLTTEREYRECVRLKKSVERMPRTRGSGRLLNGFTLGDSWSTMWRKTLSIDYFFGEKEVFYGRFNATFGYALGLRIPIKYDLDVEHSTFPVDSGLSAPNGKAKIKFDTFDADADFYRSMGLPNDKIHNGKEFVFKLYANAGARVDLLDETVFDRSWDLIRLLGNVLGINGLHNLDLSKDLKIPFGNDERIRFIDEDWDVPIYSISVASVDANVRVQSYVEGLLKFACEKINMGSCPSTNMTVNNTGRIDMSGVVRFRPSDYITDVLGGYSKFGFKLTDFVYRPNFVTDVKLGAGLNVDIPLRGRESFDLGPYTVYHFELEGPGFGSHRGVSTKAVDWHGGKIYNLDYQPTMSLAKRIQLQAEQARNRILSGADYSGAQFISGGTTTAYYVGTGNSESTGIDFRAVGFDMPDIEFSGSFAVTGTLNIANIYIKDLMDYYVQLHPGYIKGTLKYDKFKENIVNKMYVFREQYSDKIGSDLNKKFDKLITMINALKEGKDDISKIKEYIQNINVIDTLYEVSLPQKTKDSLDKVLNGLFVNLGKLDKKALSEKLNLLKKNLKAKRLLLVGQKQTAKIKDTIKIMDYILINIENQISLNNL